MALLKPIDHHGTGHVCAYWRLARVELDHEAGLVRVTLFGYRDEAARREGLRPLLHARWEFTAAALGLPSLHAPVTTFDLYRAVRADAANPLFADALDGPDAPAGAAALPASAPALEGAAA